MSDKEDPLSKAFGVDDDRPSNEIAPSMLPQAGAVSKFDEYVDADYEFARENIMNTILKAQDALDSMIDLAQVAQHPRAYEVLGGLVNTIVASNKDLLDLAKKSKELKKVEAETPAKVGDITNNNVFVGSTAELQKLLRDNGVHTNVKEIIIEQNKKKIEDR